MWHCSAKLLKNIILKTETLHKEIHFILDLLDIPYHIDFPHMRVYGGDDKFSEGGGSKDLVRKYFSQLTKQQVLRLYEMYKIDHEMFNYDPQIYIDMAL